MVVTDMVREKKIQAHTYIFYGIYRPNQAISTPSATNSTNYIDGDRYAEYSDYRTDKWGNQITVSAIHEDKIDILFDTSGNDVIADYSGNDIIRSRVGGEDWFKGGAGRDTLDGNMSWNCILEGGAGSDALSGSNVEGCQLFADSYGDMETLIEAGETAESIDQQGDLIRGGYAGGDNYLYGSNAHDLLIAYGGEDLIVGAGGNDCIISYHTQFISGLHR
jgi:Ca2+-binding RTX toxin-like protein